jgi:hypothetical protein
MRERLQNLIKNSNFRWTEQEGVRMLIALGVFLLVAASYHFQLLQRFEFVT